MQGQPNELDFSGINADLAVSLLENLASNAFESVLITAREDDSTSGEHWPIIFVNAGFEEMTGYKKEEVIGQTASMLQGPKTEKEILDRLSREVSEGRTFHGETVNYRKDGSEFVIEWKVIPVRNGQGEIAQYLSVQRDVTAQRRG